MPGFQHGSVFGSSVRLGESALRTRGLRRRKSGREVGRLLVGKCWQGQGLCDRANIDVALVGEVNGDLFCSETAGSCQYQADNETRESSETKLDHRIPL